MLNEHEHSIDPPKDPALKTKLEGKLAEYKQRLNKKDAPWKYQHPRYAYMLYPAYRDAFYKIAVLEAVLSATGPVDTYPLSLRVAEKCEEKTLDVDFDVDSFNNACGVIATYCGEKIGDGLEGGTGLPEL